MTAFILSTLLKPFLANNLYAKEKTLLESVKTVRLSTVVIETPNVHGSGTIIKSEKDSIQIITAAHVTDNINPREYSDFGVITHDGKWHEIMNIQKSSKFDIAIITAKSIKKYPIAKIDQIDN